MTKVKGLKFAAASLQAPSDAFCRINFGSPCYSPQGIRNSYSLKSILNDVYTGTGQTIIIIDSFGSPTIVQDLQAFDAGYGLPDPPSFTVLAPLGTVPFDPTNGDPVGWAFETTLDVEWAHAMAPGANIVLLTSPVSETEGVQGMPEFLALEKYALDHQLGKIISQSWAATENTLFTPAGQEVCKKSLKTFTSELLGNTLLCWLRRGISEVPIPMSMATFILLQRWATRHRRHMLLRLAALACMRILRATIFMRSPGLPVAAV